MAIGELLAWAVLAVFGGMMLGAAVAVVWAPFLRVPIVRDAVEHGPGPWWANYLLGFAVLGAVHAAAFVILFAVAGSRATVPDLLVGIPLLVGLAGALMLVRAMDAVEDVLRTYVMLMGGVLWYVLVTTVPVVLAIAGFLPLR